MEAFEEKYLNPHTDFGFKRLFGTEFNKDLLMSFLNASLRQDDEIAKLSSTELKQYEDSINAYRDIQNALNTAKKESFEEGHEIGLAEGHEKGLAEGHEKGLAEGHEKGLAEGRLQEKKAIALILKQSGTSIEVIAQATGLPVEEIQKL